jgi:hypothetical protein
MVKSPLVSRDMDTEQIETIRSKIPERKHKNKRI